MSILTEAVPIPEKLLRWFTHHCLLYMEYKPVKALNAVFQKKPRLNGFSKWDCKVNLNHILMKLLLCCGLLPCNMCECCMHVSLHHGKKYKVLTF